MRRKSPRSLLKLLVGTFLLLLILAGSFLLTTTLTSSNGERMHVVEFYEGETLSSLADELAEKDIIFSSSLFVAYMKFFNYDDIIKPRRYTFAEGEGMASVAEKIVNGEGSSVSIRLTFPEGSTNEEIAAIADARLINFDKENFLRLVAEKEGKLFPDTYFVKRFTTETELIELLEETFEEKVTHLLQTPREGYTAEEMLIMASIVEEEGKTREDREKIAGVLWKRLEMGMPLQVDAAFLKVPETEGRNTYELTDEDLRIDSPFNTYLYPGLPPRPLSNPGIEALEATLHPVETSYLYYLSEEDGTTYFAETYEEHLDNQERYLN